MHSFQTNGEIEALFYCSKGLLQEKHPTIATAVKTRHAARAIMNDLRATVLELEEDGLLEHTESNALMAIIESKMKSLGSTPVSIQPNSAEGILMNCVWLQASNPEMRAYFKVSPSETELLKSYACTLTFASLSSSPYPYLKNSWQATSLRLWETSQMESM